MTSETKRSIASKSIRSVRKPSADKPSTSKVGRNKPPAESHVYKLVDYRVVLTPSQKNAAKKADGDIKATITLFDETAGEELVKTGYFHATSHLYIDMIEGRKNVWVVAMNKGDKGIIKRLEHKGKGFWVFIKDNE